MGWVEIVYYYLGVKRSIGKPEIRMASKEAVKALDGITPETGGGVMLYCDLRQGYIYTSGPHDAETIREIDASADAMPPDSEVVPLAVVADEAEYAYCDTLAQIVSDGIAARLKRFGRNPIDASWGSIVLL